MAARSFDRAQVGQRLTIDPADAALAPDELMRRYSANRDWFNTQRPGSSNAGHDLWARIRTNANRLAVIEYLKTL